MKINEELSGQFQVRFSVPPLIARGKTGVVLFDNRWRFNFALSVDELLPQSQPRQVMMDNIYCVSLNTNPTNQPYQ
jgi:hypothetical protein